MLARTGGRRASEQSTAQHSTAQHGKQARRCNAVRDFLGAQRRRESSQCAALRLYGGSAGTTAARASASHSSAHSLPKSARAAIHYGSERASERAGYGGGGGGGGVRGAAVTLAKSSSSNSGSKLQTAQRPPLRLVPAPTRKRHTARQIGRPLPVARSLAAGLVTENAERRPPRDRRRFAWRPHASPPIPPFLRARLAGHFTPIRAAGLLRCLLPGPMLRNGKRTVHPHPHPHTLLFQCVHHFVLSSARLDSTRARQTAARSMQRPVPGPHPTPPHHVLHGHLANEASERGAIVRASISPPGRGPSPVDACAAKHVRMCARPQGQSKQAGKARGAAARRGRGPNGGGGDT